MINLTRTLLAASALLLVTACGDDKPKSKFIAKERVVYQFDDGRTGYLNNGVWWYLVVPKPVGPEAMASPLPPRVPTSPSAPLPRAEYGGTMKPTIHGAWRRGPAPATHEFDKAATTTAEVIQTKEGKPLNEVEAVAAKIESDTGTRAEPASETGEPGPPETPESIEATANIVEAASNVVEASNEAAPK